MSNESPKFPRLSTHIIANSMSLLNISKSMQNDSIISDRLFLWRNNAIEGLLKRWKSTQSSCEEDDDSSKRPRGCVDDHQQSAESCEKSCIQCDNDRQLPPENCHKSSSDLLGHREYYRSMESSLPIYSDKPLPYNDRQACDSTIQDPHECSPIAIDECSGKQTGTNYWSTGKPATKGEIYRKQKPTPCAYPGVRAESYMPGECKEESKETREDDAKQAAISIYPTQQRAQLKACGCPENISAPDTQGNCHERQIKLDPPPPRYPHWTENPPPYCDRGSKKRAIIVEPSPMIFVPKKGPWKSSMKAIASSHHEGFIKSPRESKCGETVAKAKMDHVAPYLPEISSRRSTRRCVVSFEDKCTDLLTLPAPASKVKAKIQRFPALTKCGRCRLDNFEDSDVGDCKPNVASLKYQLSKCPRIKEMWNVRCTAHDSLVDIPSQIPRVSLPQYRETKRSRRRRKETRTRKERRVRSPGGWMRQRYRVRLKIFRKEDGRLDPCLPLITELRQPRGETKPPFEDHKLFETTMKRKKLPPRSGNPCSDHCPTIKCPIENKSYPTKMNECRIVRRQRSKKCPRKKHCSASRKR